MSASYAEDQRLVRAAKLTLGIVEALQQFGQEARIAAENVDALTKAHHAAESRGTGVLAIREADGSLDCQPNVFVQPRTVVIVDPAQFPPPEPINFGPAGAQGPAALEAQLDALAAHIIRNPAA